MTLFLWWILYGGGRPQAGGQRPRFFAKNRACLNRGETSCNAVSGLRAAPFVHNVWKANQTKAHANPWGLLPTT